MTETRTGIRQSDFADKHNLKPGEVKDLRESYLVEGVDYWSVVRAIFWTPEAVEKVEKAMIEEAKPQTFLVQTFQKCPNKRMLYAKKDGERIVVFAGGKRDALVGKVIPVCKAKGAEHYIYTP